MLWKFWRKYWLSCTINAQPLLQILPDIYEYMRLNDVVMKINAYIHNSLESFLKESFTSYILKFDVVIFLKIYRWNCDEWKIKIGKLSKKGFCPIVHRNAAFHNAWLLPFAQKVNSDLTRLRHKLNSSLFIHIVTSLGGSCVGIDNEVMKK